jgi:RimJ/RimL family protein N-acetyltransferase
MTHSDLWTAPVTLTGKVVRLEPLTEAHIPGLTEAGKDESIWKYMLYGDLTREGGIAAWARWLIDLQSHQTDLPFTVFHLPGQRIAGATRYLDIRPAHRSLEIGGTWYAPEFQRTMVNTECKYLLLRYAFETLGCIRVQLKADARNERSLRAIERLGAVREGVLRNHYILPDGVYRDSVVYSILDTEWPVVRSRLEGLMSK